MLDSDAWLRLLPDVYIWATDFDAGDYRTWCEAVALAMPPGAAIGGWSAAFLWGVGRPRRDDPVSIVLPVGRRVRPHPRISAVHSPLAAEDVTTFGGLPVTSAVRTAFDLGRQAPRLSALTAVDALTHRRVVRLPELVSYVAARPGWPGAPLLREVVSLAEPLTESPMETRLRLLLVDAGAPRPVAQHEIFDRQGRFIARVDLAYVRLRIAIEYEGDHHRERAQFQRDVARLNALRAAGWIVLRFTADEVIRHPDRVVRLLLSAVDDRRRMNAIHVMERA